MCFEMIPIRKGNGTIRVWDSVELQKEGAQFGSH
jgi:hypothetical protein